MKPLSILILIILASLNFTFAQCNVGNPNGILSLAPANWAQSFTATCDGFLTRVSYMVAAAGTIPGNTIKIYAGSNTNILVYTQNFNSITVSGYGDSATIYITGSVPIINGNQYTFEINSGNAVFLGDVNTYAGGVAFFNGDNSAQLDIQFGIGISSAVSINEFDSRTIQIYPNPSSGNFTIFWDKTSSYHLVICNLKGQTLFTNYLSSSSKHTMNIDVSPGIYFVKLIAEQNTYSKKLVIY